MRIPSGVTDQFVYFVAVDATDFTTRETGLATWTVYRSRNGGAASAMTTPTINETDVTNMPGVYELLLDEDMTIDAGDDAQEMVFHITHAGMAPVSRTIELYRPKITAGNTLGVASDGDVSGNVDGTVADVVNLSNLPAIPANWITAAGIAASALNGKGDWNIGKTGYALTQTFPTNFADLAIVVTSGLVSVGTMSANVIDAASIAASALNGKGDWNIGKTGYALTTADWNVGKTGYALTTADWNVGKTGYALSSAGVDAVRDAILPTQNAAFNNIEFLFVAASDHVTPVTGASTMTVTRSIDGGAFGSGTGTGPVEVGNGIYQYDASAADMNGGIITFRFAATGGTPGAPDDVFLTIVTGGGV